MMPSRLCALSQDLLEVLLAPLRRRRSARSASRARPSRPFSGVRISWLVLARKALLARFAASAASRAAASAASRRRRSVTSSAIQIVPPSPGWSGSTACAEQAAPEQAAVARRISRSISNGWPAASSGPASRPISA